VSNKINKKYVWNAKLLEPMEGNLHQDWFLHVVHGFVGQSNVCVYGKPIFMTLIARRSAKYAGTRFLKRGSNFEVISILDYFCFNYNDTGVLLNIVITLF